MMLSTIDGYYSLYDYLDALWRRRYLFFVSLIVMPILAMISMLFIPQKYQAQTAISVYRLVPPQLKGLSYLPKLEDQFAGAEAYVRSPEVIKEVLKEVGVITSTTSEKASQQIVAGFTKDLKITLVKKTVVVIKLAGTNSSIVSEVLNLLRKRFIKQLLRPLDKTVQYSITVLKEQLDTQKNKLEQAQRSQAAYEQKNIDFLPAADDIYLTRIKQVIKTKGDLEMVYQEVSAREKALKNELIKVNPLLGSLENAILQNDMKLAELRLIYTENYPEVKAAIQLGESMRAERDNLYKQVQKTSTNTISHLWDMVLYGNDKKNGIKSMPVLAAQLEKYQEIKAKKDGIRQDIAVLVMQQNNLKAKLEIANALKQRLQAGRDSVKTNTIIYRNLLKRFYMADVVSKLNKLGPSNAVQVMEYPETPLIGIGKTMSFRFMMGLLGGIVLGGGFVFFFELCDASIRSKRILENITKCQVICRIPKWA